MTARSLPSFCLHRIRSGRTAAAPPPICSKDENGDDAKAEEKEKGCGAVAIGRKVMVVADGGGDEARTALQWALSHSVRPSDTVVLLDVVRSTGKNRDDLRGYQPLEAMRSICQAKRPEVRIELSLVEGKERGPTIVEAARKQGVSLLVMGQKKRSMTWRLLSMWMAGGKGTGGNTVEYCVQHATCMALGIRRKSRRGGGYLITTRRQRDFWLLA
ncbi:uncharacterized protein [Lolium perenne]|uniref:uncharacterized protein n=1 Tax=Lolium perenne TaxID=4522 RepID=UPI0021EA2FBA|nr:uncharacterized protein LOC127299505 [Lolium perenne]